MDVEKEIEESVMGFEKEKRLPGQAKEGFSGKAKREGKLKKQTCLVREPRKS